MRTWIESIGHPWTSKSLNRMWLDLRRRKSQIRFPGARKNFTCRLLFFVGGAFHMLFAEPRLELLPRAFWEINEPDAGASFVVRPGEFCLGLHANVAIGNAEAGLRETA